MIDVCWVKACMTASEHRHRCSSVRSITSVQSCTITFQGKSQLCYLPHILNLRTEGAIKKQVQLHDGLFLVIHVARVQTRNWALSCKLQVLPVGSFLLAQRDQRNPSSEEDNLHNTSVRKTCTVEASIHPCKSVANRQELESLSIL